MTYKESMISIIIPVCNAEKYLRETLSSILEQTYQNFEIIAIDDNSKDNSYQLLKDVAKTEKRLKVYKNIKRYGLAVCLNRLAKKAKGQYIAFMNAEDIASLHRLKRQVNFLLQNQKFVAVGTQAITIDESNKRKGKSTFPTEFDEIHKSLISKKVLQFESFMINRRFLPKDILKFPLAKYPFVFQAMVIRLMKYGRIGNLNQHLYYRRMLEEKATKEQQKFKKIFNHTSFWVKSIAVYNHRPSVRALLEPVINPVKTIFD